MRQKDANLIARILGHEIKFATEQERPGLDVAVNAIAEHLKHVQPEFEIGEYMHHLKEGLN